VKRALVVDDNRHILAVAERLLTSAGYGVVTANDYCAARADIQVLAPDVVVLDVRLGEFNGLQLGILARHVRDDVHLVVMSSWNDPVLRREAERLGATYVQKPFKSQELLAAVGA
jgi:DNA-binding response OmpR family regulator